MKTRYWLVAVFGLGLALSGSSSWAADTEVVATSAQELAELKAKVAELSEAIQAIEAKLQQDTEAAAEEKKKAPVLSVGPGGLRVSSADKSYELRVGGSVGYDMAWFRQDDELKQAVGDEQDGTGFRFARIRLQGKLTENVGFRAEYDFAGQNGQDTPVFRDVYIDYLGIPWGGERAFDIRAGHFREPFSLEELTGIANRTFVERSLANVFVPGRNAGIQISDALLGDPEKERLTLALGVFKETDDWPSSNDSDEDQGYIVTSRVTGLPYYEEDGRRLVHVGLSYSHRNPDGAALRYGLRPESRLALFRYADTDNLPPSFRLRDARAETVDLFGGELAAVYGPFSVQGEYIRSDVDTTFGGSLSVDGYYAQASYFLTGEHRPYRNTSGLFDRVTPKNNVRWKTGEERGWGAWEVAARWSSVDLNDGWLRAGQHDAATLGLNWYLNPNARITWNLTRNFVDHDLYEGTFDALHTRFQVEF